MNWKMTKRLIGAERGLTGLNFFLWISFHTLPVLTGLAARSVVDATVRPTTQGGTVALLVVGLVAAETCRLTSFYFGLFMWSKWFTIGAIRQRANVLDRLLRTRSQTTYAPGEAVGRLRDDAEEVMWFADTWLDVAGVSLFMVIAITVLSTVDPILTIAVVAPLAVAILVVRVLAVRIKHRHERAQQAGSTVTGFLGETFAHVSTLKSAGAEDRAVAHLERLGRRRGQAAVKVRVLADSLDAFHLNITNISIGLVLLFAAGKMRSGHFSAGDFTLFATYSLWFGATPRFSGRMLARARQAAVSLNRLASIAPGAALSDVVANAPLALRGESSDIPVHARGRSAHRRFAGLDVTGLTADHVHDVDLRVGRGELVVITGRIGAGKTSLLRAVLGLVPRTAGSIRWNGAEIDPADALVPPRCGYTPQAPRLFSESLHDNVTLGQPVDVDAAIDGAELRYDIDAMDGGVDTQIGPRGVRLSGGQVQRTATARMLAQADELLVVDDLSSALDVRTEERVWKRMRKRGVSVLAVSHRPSVLARADRVIVMDQGFVVEVREQGRVAELAR